MWHREPDPLQHPSVRRGRRPGFLVLVLPKAPRPIALTGRESTGDPLPKQWGGLVAHDAIEYASGLLGVDPIHVDGAGLFKGFAYFTFGDGVEDHPLGRVHVVAERFGQVPRNGFALAVKVGGKPNGIGGLGFFPKLGDGLFAVAHHLVARLEVVFEVDARYGFFHALARFGRQVADMPHAGLDVKGAQIGLQRTQVLLDGFGFRRAFHNHKIGGVRRDAFELVFFLANGDPEQGDEVKARRDVR